MYKKLKPGQIYGYWLITIAYNIYWKINNTTGETEDFNNGKIQACIAYPTRRELEYAIERNKQMTGYISHSVRVCRVI